MKDTERYKDPGGTFSPAWGSVMVSVYCITEASFMKNERQTSLLI